MKEKYLLISEVFEILKLQDREVITSGPVQYFLRTYKDQESEINKFYYHSEIIKTLSFIKEILNDENLNEEYKGIELASISTSSDMGFCAKRAPYDIVRPWNWENYSEGKFKAYTHSEETRKKISLAQKGRKQSKETRKKISAILTGRKLSEDHCQKIAKRMKGTMPKSCERKGQGVYFVCQNGKKIWMRSRWESKYASWLDEQGLSWSYEPKVFEVSFEYLGKIKESTYRPDFLVEGKEWHEVKGYWRDDAKPKFEAFKAQYPDEKITLLMKPELLALGIEL